MGLVVVCLSVNNKVGFCSVKSWFVMMLVWVLVYVQVVVVGEVGVGCEVVVFVGQLGYYGVDFLWCVQVFDWDGGDDFFEDFGFDGFDYVGFDVVGVDGVDCYVFGGQFLGQGYCEVVYVGFGG